MKFVVGIVIVLVILSSFVKPHKSHYEPQKYCWQPDYSDKTLETGEFVPCTDLDRYENI